ncbi:MAG: hypothetical protein WBM07_06120 [Chitinivibrionales bacterium]
MTRYVRIQRRTRFALLACGIFLFGCGEKDSVIREKLDAICTSDLKAITADLPKTSLSDSIYYTVVSYKSYSEGRYSKMAVVDFYFLNKVKAKIVRKYRYLEEARLWDRYSNVYTFIEDTAQQSHR